MAQTEIETARSLGVNIATLASSNYPQALRNIEAPPPVLYFRGRIELLEDFPCLGIVGARSPTTYGKEQAERFSRNLAAAGMAIVSGLARGIDSVAHESALLAKGKTVGVMGSGFLEPYPDPKRSLWKEIHEQGLVLSEFPLRMGARKENFPRRNRILSGVSKGVLVVEAAAMSGSLITAQWAIDQGKELFCIPGRIDNPMSEGCHRLLQNGAHLVTSPHEILDSFGLRRLPIEQKPNEDSEFLRCLRQGSKTLDEICEALKKTPQSALCELVELEIRGQVVRGPGGIYRCRSSG